MSRSSASAPLDRVTLGAEGLAYVDTALEQGLTLSRLVREMDLSTGCAYTLVPSGTPPPRLRRWTEGGLMSSDRGLEALVAELRPRVQLPSAILIVENAMAKPEDEVIQGRVEGCFIYDQEVYEYRIAPAVRDDIKACLRRADAGYSLNAVVVEGVTPPSKRVGEDYLRSILDGLVLIVTRAYDGEGFVLWRPDTVEGPGSS